MPKIFRSDKFPTKRSKVDSRLLSSVFVMSHALTASAELPKVLRKEITQALSNDQTLHSVKPEGCSPTVANMPIADMLVAIAIDH